MAFKLSIVDKHQGLNFNVKFENMAKAKRPEIVAKTPNGDIVKEKMIIIDDQGKIVKGTMGRKWIDDNGKEFGKSELTFWFGDEQVSENSMTRVMEIEGYQPVKNYTDNYVISTYYELSPGTNDMKKDIDKERARKGNVYQMRKLWEHLDTNQVVARGEFCPSSRGFMASDGYIRAIRVNGNKWGLEIGVFKEEKVFQHLQEGVPQEAVMATAPTKGKRLKMV